MSAALPSREGHREYFQEYIQAYKHRSTHFQWLDTFLRSSPLSDTTNVTLYSKTERNKGESKRFTGDFSSLYQALGHESSRLRAVIVCHRESCSVNREVIGYIGYTLDLDPRFLRHHFDYQDFAEEEGCPAGIEEINGEERSLASHHQWEIKTRWAPAYLPSELSMNVMHIGIGRDRMSFYMRGNTAVLLIRSIRNCIADVMHYPLESWEHLQESEPDSLAERYLKAIRTDRSGSMLQEPFDFVIPYIRLLALECAAEFAYMFDPRPLSDLWERNREDKLAIYPRMLELNEIVQTISRVIHSRKTPRSPQILRLKGLLNDFMSLQRDHGLAAKLYEQDLVRVDQEYQNNVIGAQLAEAKESKATAISVGRLAKLAFVYIPLNFVAAVLGMNLNIFGNGTIPLWVFFFLASVFVFISLLPILGSIIKYVKTSIMIGDTHLACRLAWRSPSLGLWYWLFCLVHSEKANAILRYDCHWEVLTSGRRYGGRQRYLDKPLIDIYKGTSQFGFDQFWTRRVEAILNIVDVPGWQEHSFLSRWVSCWHRYLTNGWRIHLRHNREPDCQV